VKNKPVVLLLMLMLLVFIPAAVGQENSQATKPEKQTPGSVAADTQEKNVQEYIELLRENVRQEKAELMGAM
jgi:Na+-transporting methylmalonyl-CoA/oxaloacetate decarboxylase gamma subunit